MTTDAVMDQTKTRAWAHAAPVSVSHRLIGMIRAPRTTLTAVIARPRTLDLAVLIALIATAASTAFLMTDVGRLAALDQEVRQLESMGTRVTDQLYGRLVGLQPYQLWINAAGICLGWPLLWVLLALVIRAVCNRRGAVRASFRQVVTIVVHAASVFVIRAVVVLPINYLRESAGGATSLGTLLPMLGESTFAARLLGAIDVFAVWALILLALGLSILYQRRALPVARWLFGVYAAGAAMLALTQSLRGGI